MALAVVQSHSALSGCFAIVQIKLWHLPIAWWLSPGEENKSSKIITLPLLSEKNLVLSSASNKFTWSHFCSWVSQVMVGGDMERLSYSDVIYVEPSTKPKSTRCEPKLDHIQYAETWKNCQSHPANWGKCSSLTYKIQHVKVKVRVRANPLFFTEEFCSFSVHN